MSNVETIPPRFGKEFGKMKNLFIVIVLVFCLLQLNINLFIDKNI